MQSLPLQFTGGQDGTLIAADGAMIIPGRQFILIAPIPPNDPGKSQGILAEKFRIDFQRFTFVLQYDGSRVIKKYYSAEEVDHLISAGETINREALKRILESIP